MQRWGISRGPWHFATVVAVVIAMVAGLVVGIPARAVADATRQAAPNVGPTRPSVVPANSYESFVQASYRDFLGRPPTINELNQQASRLRQGQVSTQAYLSGLSTSDEWLSAIVTKFYQDTLQRDPEPSGLAGWVGVLRSRQLSVDEVASYFYASDEFYQRFGGGALSPWVTQLYQKLLGRAPDAGGLDNWVRNANRFGRPWVSFYFYQSAESRSRRVQSLYKSLLQRDPDPTGWPYWTDVLLRMDDLVLATQLASSQEYWDNSAKRFPNVPEPLVVVTLALPNGAVSTPYSTTISASGGTPPYTWAAFDLSAGLTMDPATGVISGTPTSWALNQTVTITVIDAAKSYGDKKLSLTILGDPVISTTSLPYAVTGTPYALTLTTTAGSSPPYTWSASGLPAGVSLDPATGVLSGTPTTLGSYPVTVTLTDGRAKTAQKILTLLVRANEAVRQVTLGGGGHSCALTITGGVRCWGLNDQGQLGNGGTATASKPVDVVGLASGVLAISAGDSHTCALTAAGGVKCWGDNSEGQLGDGTRASKSTPVDVVGLTSGVVAISAGVVETCALTAGGGVKCWGENSAGSLGDGTVTGSTTPRNVVGLSSGVAAISVGWEHVCALTTGGAVKCWGDNAGGGLGDGTTVTRSTPVDVVGMASGVVAISLGGAVSCAVTSGGGAKCWGSNEYGQLGDGTMVNRLTPVSVTGLSTGVARINVGNANTCALSSGGAALCWGFNDFGSLGDGTLDQRLTPVGVVGLSSGATAVVTSVGNTCALTSLGGVKCWGYNELGGLGDGSTVSYRVTPGYVYGFAMG